MRWLIRWLVKEDDRQAIESDLAELFELRRRQEGDRAAARWLRRQHLLYPVHLCAERARTLLGGCLGLGPQLWRDFLYAVRNLLRTPTLTATIVLTVGIGLGATTGMIGVVRAVLVDPLPYAAPDELFWIYTNNPPYRFSFSVVDYRALEADHPAFSAVAAYQTRGVTITESGSAERVTSREVTGSYFPLLGQTPLLGRLFDASDDARRDRVAVLTEAYWARRFARSPLVLGRPIAIDGATYTVVGVQRKSVGPLEHGIAVFTAARWPAPTRKGPFFTTVLGRLRPDVPQAAALDALRATSARLFPVWKSSYQDEKASWGMLGLKARVVRDVGPTLAMVLAAVGCVLLIACANAVNLLIAHALNRRRELAIRSALGASRRRLLQQLLVESGVLTAGAAAVGGGIAFLAVSLVATYGAGYIPRIDEIRPSGPVVGWFAGLAIGSGALLFLGGLVPALHDCWRQGDRALRSGGRSTTDGPAARRLRRVLVAAQFALATPLIVAAVLVMASLDRLGRVGVGIDMTRVLTAGVALPGAVYARDTDRKAFWDRALERLAAMPGVEAVAIADSRPPEEAGQTNNFDLEDRPTPAGQNQPLSTWVGASPGFFRAVGLRLERGRLLDEHSLRENAVVVDRAWADRFFPGEEVLGRRLKSGGCTSCEWTRVVGVVGTVKWTGLEALDQGTVYFPFVDDANGYFVVRATGDPGTLATPLRNIVRQIDPGLAVSGIATGEDLLSQSLAAPRYLTVLVGSFALAALVLSVVGIYGVMAYFVQQHTRDIGIRLALGGEPSGVRRMVILQGLRLVAAGVAFGVAAAILGARFLASLLYGGSATDLRVMVGVPLVLLAIAAMASLAPGRRAARLDPAVILRES